MKTRRVLAAAAGLALATGIVAVTPPASAGLTEVDEPSVALFYDSDYVDTDPSDPGEAEALNLLETLQGFGLDPALIEGITAADFEAVMPVDVLLIPELEESEDLGADMSSEARAVVEEYVRSGGRLIVFGDADPWPTVNEIFGTSVASDGDNLCSAESLGPDTAGENLVPAAVPDPTCFGTGAMASTEFAQGPMALSYNNGTSYAANPGTLPAGSLTIYEDELSGLGAVTVSPMDLGSVVFIAWDWYEGEVPEDIDPGWYEVLYEALAVGVGVGDTTAVEGLDLTFTISLDEAASQDVVVEYETRDGTAVAGTDYTAQAGVAVIPAGSTSVTVGVPTLARAGSQGGRTVVLDIATPLWGMTVQAEGVGTITDVAAPTTTVPAASPAVVTPRFTG